MDNRTCPVCGIQPSQELTNCTQCGWDLSPVFGLSAKVHAEYQTKLERAKAAWQAMSERRTVLSRQEAQVRAPEWTEHRKEQARRRWEADTGFRDHGDGTVMDLRTGLYWMRSSLGQIWKSGACVGEAKAYTWGEALQAADKLNCRGGYAGYQDWRVPTKDELDSLVYCSSGCRRGFDKKGYGGGCPGDHQRPTINLEVFPNIPGEWYWSSSPDADNSHNAWIVDFNFGYVGTFSKNYGHRVRLVRAG